MAKPDLSVKWSKKEKDFLVDWTGHTYDEDNELVREGGTKKDGGLLWDHFDFTKGCLGTSLLEELEQRGYDLTTLKFSVSKKKSK